MSLSLEVIVFQLEECLQWTEDEEKILEKKISQ